MGPRTHCRRLAADGQVVTVSVSLGDWRLALIILSFCESGRICQADPAGDDRRR